MLCKNRHPKRANFIRGIAVRRHPVTANEHCPHQHVAGISSIRNSAPSAIVPGVMASKENRMASGTTPDSEPMLKPSAVTRFAPFSPAALKAISSAFCINPTSCMPLPQ